jgi:vacuolar protein sorting-associated protein 13A/C
MHTLTVFLSSEWTDLNAVDASGVYCKLSASIEMSSYGYKRTKVIRLQPHTVFTNRLGQVLYLKQHGVLEEDVFDGQHTPRHPRL